MSRAAIAAALILALGAPVYAQRGMHGFSGGRVGMGRSAPPMGFARAPQRQFFAPRPAIMARPQPAFAPQRRSVVTFGHVNRGPFFRSRGFDGRFFDGRFHDGFHDGFHHFHHRSSFVFAVPYYGAYGYGAYGSPYYGDYGYPYYSSNSYANDPAASTSYYADLSSQVNQLDSEMQQLRSENDSLRSTLEEQRRPPAPPSSVASQPTNEPATVIVYRDGRRSEVQSYAIVGSTLWLLSNTRATKVLLADVDLDQTVKANEDRGLNFLVPK
ncbi:MAG TPA: hypothetical protein VNX88_09790 [Terriglobales bacterium]|jgi:hypothetical protein|nr:hypothetical protein [Terriglobales bacterium]